MQLQAATDPSAPPPELNDVTVVVDIAADVASAAAHSAIVIARAGKQIAAPFVGLALRPPLVPQKYWPQTKLQAMAARGRERSHDQAKLLSDAIGIVVAKVISMIDMNEIIAKIDIENVIAQLDIEAIVGRVDIAALAKQVIEDVDLPEIIRDSSDAVVSETVAGVRMRAVEADERITRIVDKVLLRKREIYTTRTEQPQQPQPEDAAHDGV
jgi:hypothetical protein